MSQISAEYTDYRRSQSIVFQKTRAPFGGLSNMAAGFSVLVNGMHIRTIEALYQACRFPFFPGIQDLIISQASPMTAKMKSKLHTCQTRTDWDEVRVDIMRWCLRVKLFCNWDSFGELLISTGDYLLVEESWRDRFWGATPIDEDTLAGCNMLGTLLMELRDEHRGVYSPCEYVVDSPAIRDFLLLGQSIGNMSRHTGNDPEFCLRVAREAATWPSTTERQLSLFDALEIDSRQQYPPCQTGADALA